MDDDRALEPSRLWVSLRASGNVWSIAQMQRPRLLARKAQGWKQRISPLAANRLFRYTGDDGTRLAGFVWRGSSSPKAMVQLAHGAGEHAMRYLEPLQPLLQAGYVIYAADHRGHGMTSGLSQLGQFGPGGV